MARRRAYCHPTRDKVVGLIRKKGPMTANEIAKALMLHPATVASAIRYGHSGRPKGAEKTFYVEDYKRNFGSRGRWACIWDVGNLPDAKEPVFSKKECHERYREKYRFVLRLRQQTKRYGKSSINHWFVAMGMQRVEGKDEAKDQA